MGIISIAGVASYIRPLQAYFVHGIVATAMEDHIPFLEPKSRAELIANFLLQLNGLIELYQLMLENAVTIAPRLIKNELDRLYEQKSITELELHLKIENIVKQSNDAYK